LSFLFFFSDASARADEGFKNDLPEHVMFIQ